MADEVTPIVETVPTEAPAPAIEPIVVVEETVTPVVETSNTTEVVAEQTPIPNPVEAVLEPTLNPTEVLIEPTAQTLNPTEVESGAVGGNESLAPVAEPLKMDSGSGSGMTQGGAGEPKLAPVAEVSKPELQKPEEASLNSAKAESGTVPPSAQVAPRSGIRELLVKAQSVIQFRKRKKLDQVMGLFAKRTSVTNDYVEKILHVSDATATRYLSILEKEGKIKQTGKTGKGVLYVRI